LNGSGDVLGYEVTLERLTDYQSLLTAAKLLQAENAALVKMVQKLKARLAQLEGKEAVQLQLQIEELESELARQRKKVFGDKTEQRKQAESSKPASEQPQRGHGRREQPQLPLVEQIHTSDSELACSVCGGELQPWPEQFEESEEIDVIERQFVITKHRRQKYRCSCGGCIQTAPGPRKLFDAARYSVGFAVHVAMAKYADHLPLERQVRTMHRDGLTVDSQTLWDQIDALAKLLAPAHDRLQQYVLSQPVIGADETYWRLMGEKGKREGGDGKRWQAWAVVAPDAVCYRIEDSRSSEAAKKLLGSYSGIVITDGYSGYSSLKKQGARFRLAHCWAHVRRKFVELEEQHPSECKLVLDWIAELYAIESELRGVPPDVRLNTRQARSRPILVALQNWALNTLALPESALGKAIAYMGGVWEGLRVFLDDPNVELDNNRSERALRGVVLGRKNYYGSRSRRGTEVAALLYSLIESAKLADIEPRAYLIAAINAALSGNTIPLPHEIAARD